MTHRVWHFDGENGVRHDVWLTPTPVGLTLDGGAREGEIIGWADLQKIEGPTGQTVFAHKKYNGWRIGFNGPIPEALIPYFPQLRKVNKWRDRGGLLAVTIGFGILSAAFLFVLFKVPGWLAPLVPLSWEKSLAEPMLRKVAPAVCSTPEGDEALKALVLKLDPQADPSKIQVVKIDMVNAFALPGGHIMIFDGLLKDAVSAQEIAGVVGHEMGHVSNRDVMRGMISEFGLSLFLGGMEGQATQALANLSYSRSVESDADDYAIERLKRARISPNATADFFQKLAKEEEAMLGKGGKTIAGYLSSHPMSDGREKAFRESADAKAQYQPALSDQEWRDLVTSCDRDTRARPILFQELL